ncbi:MAG: CIA30 family protein [Sumerlaeia bacterium]
MQTAPNDLLFPFDDPRDAAAWQGVADAVMGGVSTGLFQPALNGDGTHPIAAFVGEIVLHSGKGFASVHSPPGRYDLSEKTGFILRVRGDGRRYALTLRTHHMMEVSTPPSGPYSWRHGFDTQPGLWQECRLPLSDFRPMSKGHEIENIPPLDPSDIAHIGFLISDKQGGLFRLEVDWVGVY